MKQELLLLLEDYSFKHKEFKTNYSSIINPITYNFRMQNIKKYFVSLGFVLNDKETIIKKENLSLNHPYVYLGMGISYALVNIQDVNNILKFLGIY